MYSCSYHGLVALAMCFGVVHSVVSVAVVHGSWIHA